MTLTLNLPEDLRASLSAAAQGAGVPLEDYAVRVLALGLIPEPPPIRNGADLVAYWDRLGIIGSRPEIADSQAHARALRARAEARGAE